MTIPPRRRRPSTLVSLLLAGGAVGAFGQSEPPQEFGTSAEQVSVDFVVRDKHGAFIEDLTPAEVVVREDGVRQDIESLRLVRRDGISTSPARPAVTGAATSKAGTPVVAPDGPELLALIFDSVAVENRFWARKMVTDYFNGHWRPGQHVGVFAVGEQFAVAQPFTDDKAAILGGVERALGWGMAESVVRRSDAGVLGSVNDRLRAAAFFGAGPPVSSGPGTPGQAGPRNVDLLRRSLLDDGPEVVQLRHDVESLTSLRSMMAVVNAMSAAPGRKAIVYLSDSLRLGPRTEDVLFRQLVPMANDAHVSVYTVDAAGLRMASPNQRLQAEAGEESIPPPQTGLDLANTPQRRTVGEMFNETSVRAMSQVAEATGGTMVSETNNLALGIEKADRDLASYYVLSYSPKNDDYDGRFREIRVDVRRPHGELRARKGYIAVKTHTWDTPVLAYEGPALARLDRDPKANQFPIHAEALAIPSGTDRTVAAVLVDFRDAEMRHDRDAKARLFREDFTVVAVIRDGSGRVVRKLSDYYPMTGPLGHVDEAQKVRFYRETDLAPGRYTVDVVVRDNLSGTTSVRHMTLQVPDAAGNRLRAGSLVLVASSGLPGQRVAEPFVTNGVQVFPSLDESVTTDAQGRAVVFVRAWPAPARSTVDASLELMRGDETLTTASLGRLTPDDDGRIDVLGRFPVSPLPPGEYKVRVTLEDGRDKETRSTSFRLGDSMRP